MSTGLSHWMAANRGEASSDYEPVNPQPDSSGHRGGPNSDYILMSPQPGTCDHSPPNLNRKSNLDHVPQKPLRSQSFSGHYQPKTVKKMSADVSYTNVAAHFEGIHIQPMNLSNEMTLQQFVLKHGDSLPMRVRISKGIYGTDDESTISTGDYYNLLYLQHRDLVKIEDKHHRQEFSVPVNSAIKFSMVYNPHGNDKEALKGHVFPNVSDILAIASLPKVISTLREWNSGNPSSSVIANELLIVKEVVEIPASIVGSRKQLRVYSHSHCCEKYLEEECEGHFTTRPTFTRLHLKDVFKYFPNPLPMDIVLTGDPTSTLPSYLFSRILRVSHRYTDVLMITTGVLESGQEMEPFELPIDLDIELAVVELPEAEDKKMIAESEYLLEKLKETKVRHYRYINIPDETYDLQQRILEAPPIEGSQVEGYADARERNRLRLEHRLQLLESQHQRYQEDVASLKPAVLSVSESTDLLRNNYETLEVKVDKQMEKIQLLQTQSQLYQDDVASLKPEVSTVSAGMDLLRSHYESLENTFERQTEQLQIAQAEIESLRDEVDRLRDRLQSVSPSISTAPCTLERRFSESSSTGAEEQNKEFLATLDQHQVLKICSNRSQGRTL